MAVDREHDHKSEAQGSDMEMLGGLIAAVRKERGLNQEELAREVGLTRQTLARIEKRPENASLVTINRISKALGHSSWWMLKRAARMNVTRV